MQPVAVLPRTNDLSSHLPAPPNRWQKGKDVYWYTRDVDNSEADKQAELAMVKQREQDLMMEVGGREGGREGEGQPG